MKRTRVAGWWGLLLQERRSWNKAISAHCMAIITAYVYVN